MWMEEVGSLIFDEKLTSSRAQSLPQVWRQGEKTKETKGERICCGHFCWCCWYFG